MHALHSFYGDTVIQILMFADNIYCYNTLKTAMHFGSK